MVVYLRKPLIRDAEEYLGMMSEWEAEGGMIHPGLLRRTGITYPEWLAFLEEQRHEATSRADRGPSELYFLADASGCIYGAGSTRYQEPKATEIGHVAYGIRPAERGKGYGKLLLQLLLDICRLDGRQQITANCRKENHASRAIIESCGGVFVGESPSDEGGVQLHFSIDLGRKGRAMETRFRELERLRFEARSSEASALANAERRDDEKWQGVVAEKDAHFAELEAQLAKQKGG